jgi:hypothetical protein
VKPGIKHFIESNTLALRKLAKIRKKLFRYILAYPPYLASKRGIKPLKNR